MGLFKRLTQARNFEVSFDARGSAGATLPGPTTVDAVIQAYARTFDASPDPVTITDKNGIIRYVNGAFTALTGYSAAEALGRSPRILKSGKHDGLFYQSMWQLLLSGNVWQGRMVNRKKDGSLYVDEKMITPIKRNDGEIDCFIAVRRDATAIDKAELAELRNREEADIPKQLELIAHHANTPTELLAKVVALFLSLHDFQTSARGVAFLVLHEQRMLQLVVADGTFSPQFLADEATIPMGSCLCGRAAAEGRVLVCGDCHTDPRHDRRWLGMRTHGHYTIPVRTQHRVWAVVNLYTDCDIDASDRRLSFFASAGFQLGAALEHLYRRNQ